MYRVEKYLRDYSQVIENLSKKWQKKEFACLSLPTAFLDTLITDNTNSTMNKMSGRRFTGREAEEQEDVFNRKTK